MMHKNYLTFLFLEDNEPISSKSDTQILSLNVRLTFVYLIFLNTGLSHFSASCSFTLTPDPAFLSKHL